MYSVGLDWCVMQVNDRRYLFCPARMTVGHLKRFLRCKLDLPPSIEVCKALCLEIVCIQMKPPPHHTTTVLRPFWEEATIEIGWKLERGLGPHLTLSTLGWGLPPYQVASWSMQPFGHNRYGPKIGEGELGPHLTQCGQGRGLPVCQVLFDHSAWMLQTDRTEQRSDSIGRTVLQTVA